jgi:hypothetical protein
MIMLPQRGVTDLRREVISQVLSKIALALITASIT